MYIFSFFTLFDFHATLLIILFIRLFSGELLPPEIHVKVALLFLYQISTLSFASFHQGPPFLVLVWSSYIHVVIGGQGGASHGLAIASWWMSSGDDYMGIDVTCANQNSLYPFCFLFFLSEAGQSNLMSHGEHINKDPFSFDTNHYITGHTTYYNCIWLFLFFLQELEQITISCTYWWCWVDMYGPNHRPIQLNKNVHCTNGFPRCCKKQPQFHSNFTFILRNNAHQCWPSTNVYFAKQTVTVCSFIHRFQLFTKVQFTKACWTKLPRVVGKKEKLVFGLEIET